jgi:hypothetical protein
MNDANLIAKLEHHATRLEFEASEYVAGQRRAMMGDFDNQAQTVSDLLARAERLRLFVFVLRSAKNAQTIASLQNPGVGSRDDRRTAKTAT